ncbi:MAG: bifunctional diaminohydroxyphosphoribosylaminopyrimidine deaminase/5-amino-6-(5-phosphoribosylamino)uracil reductase RibD [Tannerella sp.]|jgi:diaminohydroxyphosphoribosylaminopyrimidine deaminase/5-amino-6-(5-phosphoribosylamino)uracil reductase|nr:bifunctional diaminohydroxyphosphoribosylaminopyrimidine deaminase/5-amino-6-(5-phosphoribosylamino)uracil reductase RibD [Tannerella sp.]
MFINENFMHRCIELAVHGAGNVAPNPMVGAVIEHDGMIIGEGYHRRFGGAHAEVNAINAVRDEQLLKDATMYVNLEPCSHYGKTPPCAELIMSKRIPRVVIACGDPFPEVSGRGVRMLRDAGVEVVTGVLEKEALWLNRYFMTAHTLRRPYVILKWAQSEDGFIDRKRDCFVPRNDDKRGTNDGKAYKFSTPLTRMMVHKLRSEVQAIMVGTNTAILDNPSLTVHHWVGRSPLRVVIDRHLRIPKGHKIFSDGEETLLFTSETIEEILATLYDRGIYSLLVEGGAALHRSFYEKGLWDEIAIETTPVTLHDGVKALNISQNADMQLSEIQQVPYFEKKRETSAEMKIFIRKTE